MPLKIKTEYVFFIACQIFSLALLWVFVGGNYLLAVSHVCMWASLAVFDNLSSGAAILAFISCVIYAVFAVFVLKTQSCYRVNTFNCLFAFLIKFVVSLICGLIDLSVYEITSSGKVFQKTIILSFFHVLTLTTHWAMSETSSYIVLLVFAHIVHWAWFPAASDVASAVCLIVAAQVAFEGDTFENGSLLLTCLSCLFIDVMSKKMGTTLNSYK